MNKTNRFLSSFSLKFHPKTQKGFSLIEVMVVVAIIAVLTAMSVSQIDKLIFKARQSEARQNLSSLYLAEKNFYATYNTYFAGFEQIGFTPEGRVRYRIGFSKFGEPKPENLGGHGYVESTAPASKNTQEACKEDNDPCEELNSAKTAKLNGDAKVTCDGTDCKFKAEAVTMKSDGEQDTWSIDQHKMIQNEVVSGTGTL